MPPSDPPNGSADVRITTRDLWLKQEETTRALDRLAVTISAQDHEGRITGLETAVGNKGDIESRLRVLERWAYALPPAILLAVGSLIVALVKR